MRTLKRMYGIFKLNPGLYLQRVLWLLPVVLLLTLRDALQSSANYLTDVEDRLSRYFTKKGIY